MRRHLLVLQLLATAGCYSGGPASDPLLIAGRGNYTYVAYGANGAPILEGTLHLEWADTLVADDGPGRPFGGSWEIRWAEGADQTLQVGPQVGSGDLDGWSDEDGVRVSFNPAMMDNNVFLDGVVHGGEITGTWTYSTIAGPDQEGRFTAVGGR